MANIILNIIIVINIITIITVLFFQRRDPSTSFAWILVLIFLPIVGFVIYLLVGHKYIKRDRLQLGEESMADIRRYVENQKGIIKSENEIKDIDDKRYAQLAYMNLVNDHAILTNDNEITVYTNGADKFSDLLEDIQNAKRYIHMLYFIFRADNIGNSILRVLEDKVNAGVEVRLVYDGVGNLKISSKHFNRLKEAGGKVYKYSPLFPSIISANYRNHRKLVSIDGVIGYTGGMNVGDEYIYGRKKLVPWRDTHLRIAGSAVSAIELAFLSDYIYAANKKDRLLPLDEYFDFEKKYDGHSTMQIVSSMPTESGEHIKAAFMKIIGVAEKYIYIQTPYLVLDKTMSEIIKTAALSGVDVRIMIPLHPDKIYVYYGTLSCARNLLKYGVKVYAYNGFLHSKMIMADDKVISIGSTNMDIRSFSLSFETNAFIYDQKLIAEQREQFYKDMAHSIAIDEEYFKNIGLYKKIFMPLSELVSPLL